MTEIWRRLIAQIHAAPIRMVVVTTGGGASAIAELLSVPGGSRTVIEGVVPYSAAALADWLGRVPDRFCAEDTALAMAAVAYERGCRLERAPAAQRATAGAPIEGQALSAQARASEVVGVSCTAALVSDRPKAGAHRCFVAVQGADFTASLSLVLEKGARDRPAEESLVGSLILTAVARAADLDGIPPLDLRPTEQVATEQTAAHWLVLELLSGSRPAIWSFGDGTFASALGAASVPAPRGVLCGAFNPLHYGHERLRAAAEQIVQGPVYYEMSLRNVDKPPLDFLTINRRCAQFTQQPLALTVAPTFAEKAAALPGMVFVVGVDTAERIVHPRYYGDREGDMRAALGQIVGQGCRFLVAGRQVDRQFRKLSDLTLPTEFASLFAEVPEETFRADVSSTELREGRE
ncbi:MAG: hypothetical protein ACT4QC_10500 [Planctomycetaceae bacterium]